jgi:hypothetical protein
MGTKEVYGIVPGIVPDDFSAYFIASDKNYIHIYFVNFGFISLFRPLLIYSGNENQAKQRVPAIIFWQQLLGRHNLFTTPTRNSSSHYSNGPIR